MNGPEIVAVAAVTTPIKKTAQAPDRVGRCDGGGGGIKAKGTFDVFYSEKNRKDADRSKKTAQKNDASLPRAKKRELSICESLPLSQDKKSPSPKKTRKSCQQRGIDDVFCADF